jgi:diguanylate cyclase (GGDEF)-like protein
MIDNLVELRQLFRTDALTGVGNLIGFYESLFTRMENEPDSPFSLISIDICGLKEVNDNFGHSAGDSTLRWFAHVLVEETKEEVFRLGGDEFSVIVSNNSPELISSVVNKLVQRLNEEAPQANLKPPVAYIAVVNFNDLTKWSLVRVMGTFYHAIEKKKEMHTKKCEMFEADEISNLRGLNTSTLDMIEKLARVGDLLDQSLKLAYTDSVSGLPNMNAALRYLEVFKEEFSKSNAEFSLFLIDGDNLGQYNKISYKRGDDMIKELGTALKQGVRPDDFIARWRSGDEFIVVLPDTSLEDAKHIGNRLREMLKEVSQKWQFPITISIGVVSYPRNGITINELIDCAEKALRLAKAQGKDCVAIIV